MSLAHAIQLALLRLQCAAELESDTIEPVLFQGPHRYHLALWSALLKL